VRCAIREENGEGFPSYGREQYTLVILSHRFGVVYGDRVVGGVTKQTKLGRRGTQQTIATEDNRFSSVDGPYSYSMIQCSHPRYAWARWSGVGVVVWCCSRADPRTRKIGRSVPEIEQKWMVTVHRYVESACEETLGCWNEAGAEEGKLISLALQAPLAYALTHQNTCYSINSSWFALFERRL